MIRRAVVTSWRCSCSGNQRWHRHLLCREPMGGAIHRIALAGLPLLFSLDGQEIVFADSKEIPGKHGDQDSRRWDVSAGCRCRMPKLRDSLDCRELDLPDSRGMEPRRGEIYFWQDQDFFRSVRADVWNLLQSPTKAGQRTRWGSRLWSSTTCSRFRLFRTSCSPAMAQTAIHGSRSALPW